MEELFCTLVRLLVSVLNLHLAYRCGVSVSSVSTIATTWVQFLYIQFGRLRVHMFSNRDILKRSMPPCFTRFKNIRVIIEWCEFLSSNPCISNLRVNSTPATNITQHTHVYWTQPRNGCVMFVSDAFEASMSDSEIVKQSGFRIII